MRKWIIFSLLLAVGISLLVYLSGVWSIRGERVTIDAGEITLTGTLALPRWKRGPHPAAVIVHGSGRTTARDLRGYARKLVPHGLAVLMYDKRGVGGSGGSYNVIRVTDSEALLSQLAADAAAALDHLRRHEEIDAARVGFLGGSQAGWIMPLAARRSGKAAFIVSIAGPAVSYGQEIHYSQLTGDDPGPYSGLSDEEIGRRMEAFDGPHGYDPVPVLESLALPQLWILGGRDRSVPTELSLRNLERLQRLAPGRIDIEVHADGDHSLRDADSGKRIDYWSEVRRWLRRRGFLDPS